MEWINDQFEEDSGRKFIVISHVYPGARFKEFQLWNDKPNTIYFDVLERNKDKILIELAGHDHLASLRAAMADDERAYHNIFIAPSITPWYKNNPGVSSFEVTGQLMPQNLRSTYLNLQQTFGYEEPLPEDQLEFR